MAVWRGSWVIINEVRRYYVRRWGDPIREAAYRWQGHEIVILKWEASRNPEQVNLYATLGTSAHEMPGSPPSHRFEMFAGLEPANDSIAKPLAMVALEAIVNRTTLDSGHSVTFPDPLWPGTNMHSLLIVRPLVEIIPPLATVDGKHIEFLQVVPVFESEVAFKAEHKASELLKRWRTAHVPFWDPNRNPEPSTAT